MKNAACYARKSPNDQKVAEEAKSVTRQVELGRAYAPALDRTVEDRHVYVDDQVSGAAFGDDARPALAALLVAAERGEFDIVIMMDESRLGRDQYRSAYVLQQLHDAGVAVWYYQDKRQVALDTATGKFMESVKGYAAEMEREKAGARSREKAIALAKAGHVAGNKLFGYRNERVGAFVDRVPDPEPAATVERAFRLYADGMGDRAIRDLFNKEKVRAPRHPRPWSETTIRDMLQNETYRGVIVWNKTRAAMRRGRAVTISRPESEWERIDAPWLRIVSDDLWERANARRLRRREIYRRTPLGRLAGRTSEEDRKGLLLSGLLRCGLCGSTMWAESKVRGSKKYKADQRLIRRWGCSANIARGPAACGNAVRVVDQSMQHHIITAVRRALDPAEVAETMRAALAAQKTATEDRKVRRARLEHELAGAEKWAQNLRDAIGLGGDIPVLVGDLKAALGRVDEIQAEMRKGGAATPDEVTIEQARYRAQVALDAMQFDADRDPAAKSAAVRSMLRAYLAEPLRCFPATSDSFPTRGFRFEGELALGQLLTGATFVGPARYTWSRPAKAVDVSRSGCPSRRA